MFDVKVIADSISPAGIRLTSLQLVYPRFILAQLNTHRITSKSTSSNRAVPTQRMIQEVKDSPVVPVYWGANRPGMQATQEIFDIEGARRIWMRSARQAIENATELLELGLHKQIANRVLEPYQWSRTVITSTDWDNLLLLREHETTQPEMTRVVKDVRKVLSVSRPVETDKHLPYLTKEEKESMDPILQPICSAARCARVSYNNHDGQVPSVEKDIRLFEQLAISSPPHMSPLEHVAFWNKDMSQDVEFTRNFRGWTQFRAILENIGWGDYDKVGSTRQKA